MQTIEEANKVAVVLDKPSWRCEERAVSCRAVFFPDKETGGYTVIARNLPGVISEGDTFEEAKQKITEAFIGALQSYAERGIEVPWGGSRSGQATVPNANCVCWSTLMPSLPVVSGRETVRALEGAGAKR